MTSTRSSALCLGLAVAAATMFAATPLSAGTGSVKSHTKISGDEGGLNAVVTLDGGDRFGWAVGSMPDFDGNGVDDLLVGVKDDDDGGFGRGAVYIVTLDTDGSVLGADKISNTSGGLSASLQNGDWFGWSVCSLGDLDGDGTGDIAVGALNDSGSGFVAGAVYILFLNANGTVKAEQKISTNAGGFVGFLADFAGFGCSVANLGDLDGDGVTDLAVGSFGDTSGYYRGALYILFMNTDGTVKAQQKINDLEGGLNAVLEDGDEFGWACAPLGDLDGDGNEDVAVSAILDDDGNSDAGTVYVLFLNADGTVKSHTLIGSELGGLVAVIDQADHFGRGVANVGDLNGDGVNDLAVGSVWDGDGAEKAGAVFVLFMDSSGLVIAEQKISAVAGNFTGTLDAGDTFGNSVAPLGDINGDGILDLAVGADHDDDAVGDGGAVYVLFLDETSLNSVGNALAGTYGNPILDGIGTFDVGQVVGVSLSNALENVNAWFVLSTGFLNLPFKGGVMVPDIATGLAFTLPTGPSGDSATLGGVWPAGVPSGVPLVFQCWIPDAAGPVGFAASNAVAGTTP